MAHIFKLLRAVEWAAFEASGEFAGSPDDLRDGYIHMSTADQVEGTFVKYFAGEAGVVRVALDPQALGEALRWEPSRGGALFPHLYRALRLDEVVAATPL
ncbi:DUF952 domain-containing protein [Glacieibacterium frigidum]|uniref:DUF952 domain-containing protein n=1 Tax=Glacieibacterium frigidum TaxID=2593303 RepID=A0A552U741_9SPHN|nr:DUF952 domain-containing protein [Glacieibacterium frigidum]TRW14031.1 DUF952 domain-containing protein [Glacieibacterium frigidum]